jgi:hypothetical protein
MRRCVGCWSYPILNHIHVFIGSHSKADQVRVAIRARRFDDLISSVTWRQHCARIGLHSISRHHGCISPRRAGNLNLMILSAGRQKGTVCFRIGNCGHRQSCHRQNQDFIRCFHNFFVSAGSSRVNRFILNTPPATKSLKLFLPKLKTLQKPRKEVKNSEEN